MAIDLQNVPAFDVSLFLPVTKRRKMSKNFDDPAFDIFRSHENVERCREMLMIKFPSFYVKMDENG